MNNRLPLIDDEVEIRELAADFFSDAGYLINLATCSLPCREAHPSR